MSPTNTKMARRHRIDGFTLVEMVVIAPIIILAIGIIVALMVNLIGDVLQTRQQTAMTYSVQSALDQIEEDVRMATTIRSSSGDMPSGHGSNLTDVNGTSPFISNNSIILMLHATDKRQTDSTRMPVYLNTPHGCSSPQHVLNQTQTYQVIYYQSEGSLYRRTVLTNHGADTPCSTPWQQNSCHRASCTYKDAKILENIKNFSISYYRGLDYTAYNTADDATTTSVRTAVETEDTTAGRTVTATGAIRATKINN